MLKAEFMYCLIVRLWGQETERILVGFYGSFVLRFLLGFGVQSGEQVLGGRVAGLGLGSDYGRRFRGEWCSSVAAGCVAVWTCCKVRIETCV